MRDFFWRLEAFFGVAKRIVIEQGLGFTVGLWSVFVGMI